jgi:DNA-binding NarL/FixJ family response regulator
MIRVLVLGDVRLYREGLALIIAGAEGLQVVGSAPVHGDLVRVFADTRPDVLLLDAATVRDGAIWPPLRALSQGVEAVAYGVIDEEREAVECAEAGVSGYVPSEASREDLVMAILAVGRGEFHCPARVTRLLVNRVSSLVSERRGLGLMRALTPREKQVIALVDRGLTNKEIATQLGVELSTVKNHVHNMLEKLGAARRGEAAARVRHASFGLPLG